ncbi:MAG: hypothetical protein H0V30_15615 [Chitinophagaceae bacterium]|jgi:hypothetical protein|nr:hypothetical protein [Chitinophagaceae bacterium]
MKQKQHIDKQVEDTLNSLDGLQKASPGPYFFTRVHARLNRKQKDVWEQTLSFLLRPAVLAASVLAIILVDIIALTNLKSTENSQVAIEQAQVFSEEYDFSIATIYDYSKPDNK